MRKIAVSRFAEHSSRERTTVSTTQPPCMMGKAAARAKRRKKKQTVHKLELIATHDRANDDQEHSRFAAGRYCDVCAHGGRFRERYISALLVVSAKGSPAGLREASGSAILSAIRNIDSLVPSVLYWPATNRSSMSGANLEQQAALHAAGEDVRAFWVRPPPPSLLSPSSSSSIACATGRSCSVRRIPFQRSASVYRER